MPAPNAINKNKLKEHIREIAEQKVPLPTDVKPQIAKLGGIKAVMFDVYGTILISGAEPMERKQKTAQVKTMEQTFEACQISYKPGAPKEAVRELHAIISDVHQKKKKQGVDYPEVDIIKVWERLLEKLKTTRQIKDYSPTEISHILTDFVTRYDGPWLMPGLQKVLDEFVEKQLQAGIISNSQFYTPLTLEALSGKTLEEMGFKNELLFWSFTEDIAKPSIRFYELASEQLSRQYDINPNEVLLVGNDMLNDVYPAHEAGFKTALFAGDRRSLRLRADDRRCKNLEPDITITQLTQLLDALQ